MNSVTREIQIDAPTRTVWHHISDPAARRRWFGGDLDVDLSPGQHGTFATPDADRPVRVDDVDRGRSVTFTWGDGGDASQVKIEVEADGTGSRVRVTETTDVQQPVAPPADDEPSADSTEPTASLHPLPRHLDVRDDGPPWEQDGNDGPGGWAPPAPLAHAA